MRASRVILGLVLVIVLTLGAMLCYGPLGPFSPYKRFVSKDQKYYSKFAEDCDAVLQQHPVFTKHLGELGADLSDVWIDDNDVIWNQIEISGRDASLPIGIRRLHSDKVKLAPNRVWIGFGIGRGGWSIIWELDDTHRNEWVLETNAEGWQRQHFRRTKGWNAASPF